MVTLRFLHGVERARASSVALSFLVKDAFWEMPLFVSLSRFRCLNLKQSGLCGDLEGLVPVRLPSAWVDFDEEMVTGFFVPCLLDHA